MNELEALNEQLTKRYNQLFYAVLHSSELLINDIDIDEMLNEVIAILGESAEIDRCYILKNNFKEGELSSMNYAYEWVNKGVRSLMQEAPNREFSWEHFEPLKKVLLDGFCFYSHTKDIKEQQFKSLLEERGTKSLMLTPIVYDKKIWGILGFDICSAEHTWLEMETSTFISISSNIGAFLKRNDLAKELDSQYHSLNVQKEFYESIFRNIPADIVALDAQQRYIFLNQNSVQNDEIRNWLVGKDDFEYCEHWKKDTRLAEIRRGHFSKMLADKQPYAYEEIFPLENGKYKKHLRKMHPVLDEKGEITIAIGYGMDITRISEQDELITKQSEAIKNSPDGIALLNSDGLYTYMNKAHEDMFGYATAELIGKSWHVLYDEIELKRFQEVIMPRLGKLRLWNGECVGLNKKGEAVYQDITLRLLEDDTLICITRDVSDLKKNMHLLEQANQKLELAINTSNLGMWEWNMQTDELESNDIFKRILGFENVDGFKEVRMNWFENIHEDDRASVEAALKSLKRSPGSSEIPIYNTEYRIKTQHGNYIWVLDFGKVIDYSELGDPIFMVGFILDITSNKKIEEQIRANEKRYRDLVENLREVIFETDENGKFKFINPAWSNITGFTRSASLGKFFLSYCDTDFATETIENFQEFLVADNQLNLNLEYPLRNVEGDLIWFDVEINKIFNSDNTLSGMVGSIEDITTRKSAEVELKHSLESEKQLGELKSRFVNMASHEFRTPLAGIRSSAELIRMYSRKNEILKKVFAETAIDKKIENIIFDVDRITSLMTDVLTMGKIEVEKVSITKEEIEIVSFTEDYLNNEATRYIQGHEILFDKQIAALKIWFDPKLLVHVFNNLISNAAKYSETASLIIVRMERTDDFVSISVSDKGIGIPENELAMSFESFFRSSNVENIPGTGLGLSIAKYFMDLHEGKIAITSVVGEGTTLTLQLPIDNLAV